jgi:hypothetical protein
MTSITLYDIRQNPPQFVLCAHLSRIEKKDGANGQKFLRKLQIYIIKYNLKEKMKKMTKSNIKIMRALKVFKNIHLQLKWQKEIKI